jgi:hypothetical protein
MPVRTSEKRAISYLHFRRLLDFDSVKLVAGLEATYTEHGFITSEKPKNSSKSRACDYVLFMEVGR